MTPAMKPAIGLRLVQVRSSEEAPPPVFSGVPQVVAAIAKEVGLEDAGVSLLDSVVRLAGDKQAPWLARLLLNPSRTQPVIVISGGVDASADRLAARLAGVAHVVCIDDAISSQMVRAIGRERSVYGHAIRMYRPGFSLDADPYEHPVWTLKGTFLPRWLVADIFEQACAISLEVGDLDERAPSFQTIRNLLAERRQAASEQRLAELRPLEQRFGRALAERKGVADARLDEFRWLLEELRISLFAQELRTPQPVSVKRLEKAWEQMQR